MTSSIRLGLEGVFVVKQNREVGVALLVYKGLAQHKLTDYRLMDRPCGH